MTQKEVDRTQDPEGPTVATLGGEPVRIPESALRGHTLVVGQAGSGKTTTLLHILAHRLRRKAEGENDEAIVVIDPQGDLVQGVLRLVPREVAGRVALLDFADADRTPGINPLDPEVSRDRDECCRAIAETVAARSPRGWNPRSEYALEQTLRMLHEFNSHANTPGEEMLTLSEAPRVLEDGVRAGTQDDRKITPFQRRVMLRLRDPQLKDWFLSFLALPAGPRNQVTGTVNGHIGKLEADRNARMALEQAQSTLPPLDRMMSDGLVLLVNTAQDHVGATAAALLGNAIASMTRSAARRVRNADCLLVCEDPALLAGTGWETMLRGQRDGNLHLLLSTTSLSKTRGGSGSLYEEALLRAQALVALQMTPGDARRAGVRINNNSRRGLTNQQALKPGECVVHLRDGLAHDHRTTPLCLPPPEDAPGHLDSIRKIIRTSENYSRNRQDVRREIDRRTETRWEDPAEKLPLYHPEDSQRYGGPRNQTERDLSPAARRYLREGASMDADERLRLENRLAEILQLPDDPNPEQPGHSPGPEETDRT